MSKENSTNQQKGQNELNRREFLKKSGRTLTQWGPVVSAIGVTATFSAYYQGEKLASEEELIQRQLEQQSVEQPQKIRKVKKQGIFVLVQGVLGLITFFGGWAMLDIGIDRELGIDPRNAKKI